MAVEIIPDVGVALGLGSVEFERNRVYPLFRKALWNGDVADVGAADVRTLLVDTTKYGAVSAHQYLSDVPEAARVAVSKVLGGVTFTGGVMDANNVRFDAAVSGAVADGVVTYIDSGSAATSRLISFARGANYTPSGAWPEVQWHPNGVCSLAVDLDGDGWLYPKWLEALWGGVMEDAGGLAAADLRLVLIESGAYTYSAAHEFVSSVTYAAMSEELTGVEVSAEGVVTAANARFDAVTAAAAITMMALCLWTGTAATSRLVGYYGGVNWTPGEMPMIVTWNPDGTARITEVVAL